MKLQKIIQLILFGTVGTAAQAADSSFTGNFSQDADHRFFSFTSDGAMPISLETVSYDGGKLTNGQTIPGGGFDPMITVMHSSGLVIGQNDDKVPGVQLDSLYQSVLNPGTYWVALTQSMNPVNNVYYQHDPNPPNGFTQTGNYTGPLNGCSNGQFCNVSGENRLPNYALNITGANLAQEQAVFIPPPPPTPAVSNINTAQPYYLASGLGYTVNPAFEGGTLRVDAPGTYSKDFTINNQNGTLDGFGNTSVFTGVFSDLTAGAPGGLTIANSQTAGSVTFTGVNTYTGSTTINPGATLALAGAGSIASSSGLLNFGMFDISQTTAEASVRALSGDGSVNLGSNNLTLTGVGSNIGGVISGAGGLIVAGGTDLTGANTFTGQTTINPSVSLFLAGIGSIANSREVVANGNLDISQTTAGASIKTLSGNGWVYLGSQNLTLTNALGNFGGSIGGTGGLIAAGGEETLSGINAYAGQTTINPAATLALAGTGGIANSNEAIANGTFDISQTTAGASIKSLSGTGTVSLGSQNLILTNAAGSLPSQNGAGGGSNGGGSGSGLITTNISNSTTGAGLSGTIISIGLSDPGSNTLVELNGTSSGSVLSNSGLQLSSSQLSLSGNVADITQPQSSATLSNGTSVIPATISGVANLHSITADLSSRTLLSGGTVSLAWPVPMPLLQVSPIPGQFDGVIAGTGGLTVAGGTEILTGVNAYTGQTAINNGAALGLKDAGSIASSSGLLDNGTFDISQTNGGASIQSLSGSGVVNLGAQTLILGAMNLISPFGGIFAGTINGSGGVVVRIGHTLQLTGENTYLGDTETSSSLSCGGFNPHYCPFYSSMLTIGDGGTSGSIVGNILNNGVLVFNRADAVTFDGTISGGGGFDRFFDRLFLARLIKQGAGTLELTADNTYLGNTIVEMGKLILSGRNDSSSVQINSGASLALLGNGSIANSREVIVQGTFDISQTAAGASIQSLSGGGAVNLGAQNLTLTNASGNFGGAIGGTGGLVVAGGTETLSGVNIYTGGTLVNPGAGLALAGVGSIANSASVLNNGLIDISQTLQGSSLRGLTGSGLVNLGAQTLTLFGNGPNGPGVAYGQPSNPNIPALLAGSTFAGSIVGTGGVAINPGAGFFNGTQVFTGNNTYTGGTVVNPGATLQLGNGGTTGMVAGNVNLYFGSLLFNRADAVTFSGQVSGIGSLIQGGYGTLTLKGDNTYLGTTRINSGATLQIGNGGTTGSIASYYVENAGSLIFNRSDTVTFNGSVYGPGSLTQAGRGTLILTGENAYSGTTRINSGATLQIGNGGTSGSIDVFRGVENNGSLIFNRSDSNTYRGPISGSGSLTQAGQGVLRLTATNTYTGLTTIDSGGTLALEAAPSAVGSIAQSSGVIANGTFDMSESVCAGGGCYPRNVAITTLTGTGAVALGQNTLTLTQAAGNFGGVIGGTGGLTLLAGAETLSGANTYTGQTTINPSTALTLADAGSIANSSQVVVNGILNIANNGTGSALQSLSGTGTVNGPVNVSGTLSPGNSPGTLTANGTVTMNGGSVFKAEIDGTGTGNGAGNYDRLVINGAGNRFVNHGANLDVAFTYSPRQGDRFKIISAEGGIEGRFAAISSSGLAPGLRAKAFNDGNNGITLFATPSSYSLNLQLTGANANARSVGNALNGLTAISDRGYATALQEQLLYSVAGLNAVQLRSTATALAGEVHGAMAAAAPEAGRWLQGAVSRQLSFVGQGVGQQAAGIQPGDHLWFDFNASQGHADSDGYASAYGYSRYQFAIGGDVLHDRLNRFGVGFTYASTAISPKSGSGTVEEAAPFLYGQYALNSSGRVIVDGLFSYGFASWKTERANPLYLTGPLKGNASGANVAWSVGVRSPWEFNLGESEYTVEPFVRVLWQSSDRGGFNEGFSPSALSLSQYSLNGTRLLAGAAFGTGGRSPSEPLGFRASLAFGNDFGDLIQPAVSASLAGADTKINAPHVGSQFGQLSLNGSYRVIGTAYAYVGVNGEAREGRLDGGVNAGFNWKF